MFWYLLKDKAIRICNPENWIVICVYQFFFPVTPESPKLKTTLNSEVMLSGASSCPDLINRETLLNRFAVERFLNSVSMIGPGRAG